MMTENDVLGEIVHVACQAMVADMTDVKRQALADIAMAVASVLPVDVSHGATETRSEGGEEPKGLEKFLTVAPGVTLVRFAGEKEIRLVARRKGTSGNPNTLFEIVVDKAKQEATVYRDDRLLFTIVGDSVGHNYVEQMAVSALHRWFKHQRKRPSKRRRAAKKLRVKSEE